MFLKLLQTDHVGGVAPHRKAPLQAVWPLRVRALLQARSWPHERSHAHAGFAYKALNNKESACKALQNTEYVKSHVLCSASYVKSPCYVVVDMQSLRVMQCFICKVSLLCSALHAKCPYSFQNPQILCGNVDLNR